MTSREARRTPKVLTVLTLLAVVAPLSERRAVHTRVCRRPAAADRGCQRERLASECRQLAELAQSPEYPDRFP